MRLLTWLIWRWFGAYQIDEDMLAATLAAIEEDGARMRRT